MWSLVVLLMPCLCTYSAEEELYTIVNVKIGDSISVLTNDPDFHPMVADLSEIFIDEKTGKKSIGIAINSTGDDDWVYYTFGMDMVDSLNITISYMGYQQIN